MLLFAAIICVAISFFVSSESSLDIHLHDTYFIIWYCHILLLAAVLFAILWILYWVCNRFLYSKKAAWICAVLTIISLATFLATLLLGNSFLEAMPRRYYDLSNWKFAGAMSGGLQLNGIAILLFTIAQLIFLFNLVIGLFRKSEFQLVEKHYSNK